MKQLSNDVVRGLIDMVEVEAAISALSDSRRKDVLDDVFALLGSKGDELRNGIYFGEPGRVLAELRTLGYISLDDCDWRLSPIGHRLLSYYMKRVDDAMADPHDDFAALWVDAFELYEACVAATQLMRDPCPEVLAKINSFGFKRRSQPGLVISSMRETFPHVGFLLAIAPQEVRDYVTETQRIFNAGVFSRDEFEPYRVWSGKRADARALEAVKNEVSNDHPLA